MMKFILALSLLVVTGCAFFGFQSEYSPTSTEALQQWKIKKVAEHKMAIDYAQDTPIATFDSDELNIEIEPIVKNQVPISGGLIIPVIPMFFLAGSPGEDRKLIIKFTPKVKNFTLSFDEINVEFEDKKQKRVVEVFVDKEHTRKNIEMKWVGTDLMPLQIVLNFRIPKEADDSKFAMTFVNLKTRDKLLPLQPLHFKFGRRFFYFWLSGP